MNTPASIDDGRYYENTFVHVWTTERSKLIRFSRALSGLVDSEQLVDETFSRAWKHWSTICDEKPVAWLYRVTHNLVVDEARRITREAPWVLQDHLRPYLVSPMSNSDDSLELRETLDAIRKLPPQERCALALELVGFTGREIASIMSTGRRNVSYLLSHARNSVARSVGNQHRRQRKAR